MVQSHALLHYSVLKNLAELAEKENDIDLALEYYMEVENHLTVDCFVGSLLVIMCVIVIVIILVIIMRTY